MTLAEQAELFLSQPRIAVVGVSGKGGTGRGIYDALRQRGHELIAVNPNLDDVDGDPCYPDLQSVPGSVDAVVIVTRPEITVRVARDCIAAGVKNVWMHHNPLFGKGGSSVSAEAVDQLRQNGVTVIDGGCPLMFGRGADLGHRCMRWLLNATGKLPKPVTEKI